MQTTLVLTVSFSFLFFSLDRPHPAPVTSEASKAAFSLPESFDWRNVNGQNFVSPVRNQEQCGSCFSFASLAMLEARLRIATNNTVQKVFGPQDVVACSEYSQGMFVHFGERETSLDITLVFLSHTLEVR